MSKKSFLISLAIITGSILVINLVLAWTSPSVDPPGGNLPAPLNVGSDTQTKTGNLILEGFLRLGQLTSEQRDSLSPENGSLFYNTTENKFQGYSSGVWRNVGAKLSLGQSCSLDGDCDSSHCIDGVCCNTICDGNCNQCNAPGYEGTCTNVDSNCTGNCDVCTNGNCVANDSLCTGNCDVCNGSGTAFSCVANDSLCTGNCDVCNGSGTAFSCAANDSLCTGNCDVCSGSERFWHRFQLCRE